MAREKKEYVLIKEAVKDIPPEEAARRLAAQNAEKDFINGKAGGQPLTQLVSINQIRQKSSPTNVLARPLRSSQSFIERRETAF